MRMSGSRVMGYRGGAEGRGGAGFCSSNMFALQES